MKHRKLAIIGAGSGGLITLKTALDHLPQQGWKITCFEKGNDITGCWGNPYSGFISTSTKYTTQFSAFRRFDCSIDPQKLYSEFFKDGEYGDYLTAFAEHFSLSEHIRFNRKVISIIREQDTWGIRFDSPPQSSETFDAVIICTGLVQKPNAISIGIPHISSHKDMEAINNQTVVVIGGGESAADISSRLANPALNNHVYLSLRNGIRVSPRYHPIHGIPSDFLRNRLMLSISLGFRNAIGQKFVESRIRYQTFFRSLFPDQNRSSPSRAQISKKKKEWDLRLTAAAKDSLFNTFHNKSDGFLDAVAEERIKIIGPPADSSGKTYKHFQSNRSLSIDPDLAIPAMGYHSKLEQLFEGKIQFSDFYLGCTHVKYDTLFLVGFARPIIGNIPTISEQQAKFIIKQLADSNLRPANISQLHQKDQKTRQKQFSKLPTDRIYPVEMFPYCDQLASLTGCLPTLKQVKSLKHWIKIQLSPASTIQYLDNNYNPSTTLKCPVYLPTTLNILLLIIKGIDLYFQHLRGCEKSPQ